MIVTKHVIQQRSGIPLRTMHGTNTNFLLVFRKISVSSRIESYVFQSALKIIIHVFTYDIIIII